MFDQAAKLPKIRARNVARLGASVAFEQIVIVGHHIRERINQVSHVTDIFR